MTSPAMFDFLKTGPAHMAERQPLRKLGAQVRASSSLCVSSPVPGSRRGREAPTCLRLWSSRCSWGSGGLCNVPGGRSLPVPTQSSVWESLCPPPFVSRAHLATNPPGRASPLSLRRVLGTHPSSTRLSRGLARHRHTQPQRRATGGHGGAPPECTPPKGKARPDRARGPLQPEGPDRGVGKGPIVAQGHCFVWPARDFSGP